MKMMNISFFELIDGVEHDDKLMFVNIVKTMYNI